MRESEACFRAILENLEQYAIALSSEGRIAYVNGYFLEMTGWSESEMLDAPFLEKLLPSDHRREMEKILEETSRRARRKGCLESALLTSGGEQRYVSWSYSVDESEEYSVLFLGQDITERLAYERDLETSRGELRQVLGRSRLLNRIASEAPLLDSVGEMIRHVVRLLGEQYPNCRAVYGTISPDGALTIHSSIQPKSMPSLEGLVSDLTGAPRYLESLRSQSPLVVEDVAGDQRFEPLAAEMEAGATGALMDMPVVVAGRLLGLLCVDAPAPRHWRRNDISILSEVADYLSLLIRLKRGEEELARELEEKRVLLNEIHHRVKNNLTVVGSLLSLQAAHTSGFDQIEDAFENSRNRIHAMALVHKKLYEGDSFARVNMREYLLSVIEELDRASGQRNIALRLEAEELYFDLDAATPCGLIVNELVTNAAKHAFPAGRPGAIVVRLQESRAGGYILEVEDDGVGMELYEESKKKSRKSLGHHLVEMLVEQLQGTLTVVQDKGTCFRLALPSGESLAILEEADGYLL